MACLSPRSATIPWARPPSALMAAVAASTSARVRATRTTCAPRRASERASAAPRPRPPPVTRAEVPWRVMAFDVRRLLQNVDQLANGLESDHLIVMSEAELADRVAANVRHLRAGRGLTQAQAAAAAGLPRATWAHLESGGANPTLQVIHRAAQALQVSIEE